VKTIHIVAPTACRSVPGVLLLAALLLSSAPAFCLERPLGLDEKLGNANQEDRENHIPMDALLEGFDLKGDLDVLDLGAGTGFMTLPMARKMNNQGRLWATDVDPDMLNLIGTNAKKEGFNNVNPVKVKPMGLDDFYKTHKFDRIVVLGVYEYIDRPALFFKQLRPSLKPGGKLIIIYPKLQVMLSQKRWFDLNHLSQVLAGEGTESPVLKRMDPKIRALFTGGGTNELDYGQFILIVDDLNKIMNDPTLPRDLLAFKGKSRNGRDGLLKKMKVSVRPLVQWLVHRFAYAMTKPVEQLTPQERNGLLAINYNVFYCIYIDPAASLRGFAVPNVPLESPKYVRKAMEDGGYRFVGTKDFLHYYDYLEFTAE
jgi:SAM-dependent methyltransferase